MIKRILQHPGTLDCEDIDLLKMGKGSRDEGREGGGEWGAHKRN